MKVAGGGSPFVWLHNGRPLMNGGKSSGGGSVSIRLDGNQTNWTSWTSRLNIHQADSSDSGNYSCVPWRGETASASVFISQGNLTLFLFTYLFIFYCTKPNTKRWRGKGKKKPTSWLVLLLDQSISNPLNKKIVWATRNPPHTKIEAGRREIELFLPLRNKK